MCIFCKIAAGEVPAMKVYEDDAALVFMDIAGDVDGHMLAIPKKHASGITDCAPDTLSRLMNAVQTVSKRCTEKCGYEGVNLLNASGESAGQSVPHFHIHIIPRKDGDGVEAWPVFTGAKEDVQAVWEWIAMEKNA